MEKAGDAEREGWKPDDVNEDIDGRLETSES